MCGFFSLRKRQDCAGCLWSAISRPSYSSHPSKKRFMSNPESFNVFTVFEFPNRILTSSACRVLSTVRFTTPQRATSSAKSMATSALSGSEPKSVTVATQSDYRESEAQTVPYTPDYVIPEGVPEPEILGLQELTYGKSGFGWLRDWLRAWHKLLDVRIAYVF